jgi:hypothetical protein
LEWNYESMLLDKKKTSFSYILFQKDALRQDDSPQGVKNQFMTAIAPIYFVVFVLMAQFVLVNVVVAVLMKKLDVNKRISLQRKAGTLRSIFFIGI